MSAQENSRLVHSNLDTTYVNLAALLHYLKQHDFIGRVHVQLANHDADVFLNATKTLRVREVERATGKLSDGNEALQRLLVRASAAGGVISVYEGIEELVPVEAAPEPKVEERIYHSSTELPQPQEPEADEATSAEAEEWRQLVAISGQIIGAIERVAQSLNVDFAEAFHATRIELADDYSFLDPTSERFEYVNGHVQLFARPSANAYVSAVTECMRRLINRFAVGEKSGRIRERFALELAIVARRKRDEFARFKLNSELDRMVGTKVL
jgi:hypothetical protein